VLQLDADGEIVDSLQDPDGVVFGVTSATPHDGALSSGRCSATASSAPTSSDPAQQPARTAARQRWRHVLQFHRPLATL
jgi:hypothetical protein